MKTYTASAQTVLSAAKHQWKAFLAVVLVFAVLGGVGGWLFAGKGSSEVGGGGANLLPQVELETVVRSPAYFNDCLDVMADRYLMLNRYLGLGSVVNTLPQEQAGPLQERLDALNKEKWEFLQFMLVPLQNTLEESGELYIPEEFLDNIAGQYERQLTSIKFELIAAEAAAETVRQMGIPNYYDQANYDGSSVIINSYTSLLMQAADYGNLLKSQAVLKEALRRLRDEPEQMRVESRQVEQELNEAAAELDALLDAASQFAQEVGKAANLSFSLERSNTSSYFAPPSYKLVTKHTYKPTSLAESFAAIELFCVLVGICVGGFLAVCREAKAKKDTTEKLGEGQHAVGEE